ncbi:unnamed protein product [Diabrotica balteata]|uniref:C-type lectin domain-containing protein n=1 Tax=Diabrotica balteata TaxID=107213 RepID=A0A9N9T8F2_DIABA|nr:unnamed protein product [Diabrotica balteata]
MLGRSKCVLLAAFVIFQVCSRNIVKAQDEDEAVTKYKLTFLNETEPTYRNAQIKCKDLGMDLISIKSKEKNDAIFKHVSKIDNSSCYFTGAKRPLVNKAFVWPDETRLGFRNFGKNMPNNDGQPLIKPTIIVVVKSDGTDLIWKDAPYVTKCKPICEKMSDREMDPGPPPPPNPDQITFTEFFTKGQNRITRICEAVAKGSPLYIKNQKQMDELHEQLKANDDRYFYYLPMKRQNKNSPFMWEDGTEVTWMPNSVRKKDLCMGVKYRPAKNATVWEDANCYQTLPTMCVPKYTSLSKDGTTTESAISTNLPTTEPSTSEPAATEPSQNSEPTTTGVSSKVEQTESPPVSTPSGGDANISESVSAGGSGSTESQNEVTTKSEGAVTPTVPLETSPGKDASISGNVSADGSDSTSSQDGSVTPNVSPKIPLDGDASISGNLSANGSGSTDSQDGGVTPNVSPKIPLGGDASISGNVSADSSGSTGSQDGAVTPNVSPKIPLGGDASISGNVSADSSGSTGSQDGGVTPNVPPKIPLGGDASISGNVSADSSGSTGSQVRGVTPNVPPKIPIGGDASISENVSADSSGSTGSQDGGVTPNVPPKIPLGGDDSISGKVSADSSGSTGFQDRGVTPNVPPKIPIGGDANISGSISAGGSGSTDFQNEAVTPNMPPTISKPPAEMKPGATVSGGSDSGSLSPVGPSTLPVKSLDLSGRYKTGAEQNGKSNRCKCRNKKNKEI